jgi:mercuric ion binding protein
MKIFQLLFMVGVLLIAPLTPANAQETSTQSATIQVDGLSCPFCAYGLEKHLKKIDGVKGVEINMKTGKATVALKPGAQVNDATLTEAVKKAGFTARGITRP